MTIWCNGEASDSCSLIMVDGSPEAPVVGTAQVAGWPAASGEADRGGALDALVAAP